jgi:hypothetical protein
MQQWFGVAFASGSNFDAAPAALYPTLLYGPRPTFFKTHKSLHRGWGYFFSCFRMKGKKNESTVYCILLQFET